MNQDIIVVDGKSSVDHSLQISMQNLRLRDDHGNHKKDQMDDTGASQNLKPEARANSSYVLPENKLRKVLGKEVLIQCNRY